MSHRFLSFSSSLPPLETSLVDPDIFRPRPRSLPNPPAIQHGRFPIVEASLTALFVRDLLQSTDHQGRRRRRVKILSIIRSSTVKHLTIILHSTIRILYNRSIVSVSLWLCQSLPWELLRIFSPVDINSFPVPSRFLPWELPSDQPIISVSLCFRLLGDSIDPSKKVPVTVGQL